MISPPVFPLQTINKGGGTFVTIDAIQVGVAACVEPPGSLIRNGTVTAIAVIILILG